LESQKDNSESCLSKILQKTEKSLANIENQYEISLFYFEDLN